MTSSFETKLPLEQLMPLFRETLAAGGNVRFRPNGTSMLPLLRQGRDEVILSPLPDKLGKYDVPLYRRDNGQYVLHRIVRAGDTFTCIGDNQFDEESGLHRDQMIAVMSGFVRDGQEYPVSDFRYQAYCRLWHWSRPLRYFLRRAVGYIRRRLK